MSTAQFAQNPKTTSGGTMEIDVRGKTISVPSAEVEGKTLIIKGRLVKIAEILDEEWLDTDLQNPELCIAALKEVGRSWGVQADLFTFAQRVPGSAPIHPYAAEVDSVAAIRTDSFQQWWEALPQETRKNVRRSQKRGVTTSVKQLDDDLIRGIMGVNNDSPVRQNLRFLHYGKDFEQVTRDQSSWAGRSDFVCAYAGEELIGFLKLVYRGEVASILQILPKQSQYDKRPANALIAKAVEVCSNKGISYLTYGMFNYGNKRHSPLREFKIRNGFGEVLAARYYIPLSRWGALCMKLTLHRLHRGWVGVLPHSVITLGVGVRAKFNQLRFSR